MLRTIPSSATAFAADGIIPASAVGAARDAQQLGEHARRRAGAVLQQAQADAAAMADQAVLQGYIDAHVVTLGALLPALHAALTNLDGLRADVLRQVATALQACLHEQGVQQALIERCLAHLQPTATARPILRLPEHAQALFDALSAALPADAVDVRRAAVLLPSIEWGQQMLELDPAAPLQALAAELFDSDQLQADANAAAQRFLAQLGEQSRSRQLHRGLSILSSAVPE